MSKGLMGNVWGISRAYFYLANNENSLYYTDLSHTCDTHSIAEKKVGQVILPSY